MCYSKNEIFSCKRINSYYNVISEFDLRIPDQNSDITIINEINNATLFFMNKKSDDNIYKYTIYPQKCQVITQRIAVYNNFEVYLNDNFEYKDNNSKYYLELLTLPSDFGYMTLNVLFFRK